MGVTQTAIVEAESVNAKTVNSDSAISKSESASDGDGGSSDSSVWGGSIWYDGGLSDSNGGSMGHHGGVGLVVADLGNTGDSLRSGKGDGGFSYGETTVAETKSVAKTKTVAVGKTAADTNSMTKGKTVAKTKTVAVGKTAAETNSMAKGKTVAKTKTVAVGKATAEGKTVADADSMTEGKTVTEAETTVAKVDTIAKTVSSSGNQTTGIDGRGEGDDKQASLENKNHSLEIMCGNSLYCWYLVVKLEILKFLFS